MNRNVMNLLCAIGLVMAIIDLLTKLLTLFAIVMAICFVIRYFTEE